MRSYNIHCANIIGIALDIDHRNALNSYGEDAETSCYMYVLAHGEMIIIMHEKLGILNINEFHILIRAKHAYKLCSRQYILLYAGD